MRNLKIGSKIIIGKKLEVKAEVLSISSKIKIQREDKDKPTYIYEKNIVKILDTKKEDSVNKTPKYVDAIIKCINNNNNTIVSICKTIPSVNSATGFIRPSQLASSIIYLINNNIINKENKTFRLL